MSEETTNSFNDAVSALESIISDPKNEATETAEEHETDADADEVEAQDESEDDASDEESEAEDESDEEEAEDEEQDDENILVTVKIDGKSQKVPLKEVLNGYQQNSSYTQKSMQLANERKAFQAEAETVRQERAVYAQLLGGMQAQVEMFTEQPPNWEWLRVNDPQNYVLKKLEWQELREKQTAITAEQERIAYEERVAEVREFDATVTSERELLLQRHPELRDPKVWAQAKKRIFEFGRDVMGFSEEDLKSSADHRAVSSLYLAMKGHRAANTKGEPVRSSAKRIPVGSTSATPRKANASDAAMKRLKSSGSISDGAEAIRHLL